MLVLIFVLQSTDILFISARHCTKSATRSQIYTRDSHWRSIVLGFNCKNVAQKLHQNMNGVSQKMQLDVTENILCVQIVACLCNFGPCQMNMVHSIWYKCITACVLHSKWCNKVHLTSMQGCLIYQIEFCDTSNPLVKDQVRWSNDYPAFSDSKKK